MRHARVVTAFAALAGFASVSGSALAQTAPMPSPTAAECAQSPTPKGCIRKIHYLLPGDFTAQRQLNTDGEGVVSGKWTLSTAGPSQQFPTPIPLADARKIAAASPENSVAPSPAAKASQPALRSPARRRADFYGECTYSGRVHIVPLGGGSYHMHALSNLACFNVDTFSIDTDLDRDGGNEAFDGHTGLFEGSIATDAYTTCHDAGAHVWVNDSDFTATVNGELFQGPNGPIDSEAHRCY